MENCKDSVEVTMRAMILDVTPAGDGDGAAAPATPEPADEASAEPAEAAAEAEVAAIDPEMIAAGEKVFKKCKACHQVGDSAKNRVGPVLNGVLGHPAGQVDGFKYSGALTDMADDGLVWDADTLRAFLADPRGFMKGTNMSFAGLRKDADLDAVIAYLSEFSG